MWPRNRKKQRALYGAALALAATLAQSLLSSNQISSAAGREQSASVLSVIDGDTISVTINGDREHVRLIGIDTPESRPNQRLSKQATSEHLNSKKILELGAKASAHTKALLPKSSPIRLEYDVQKRDRYGRLLAYVWLPNGTMLNEEIVQAGFAYLLTIPPNVKYRERFADAFRQSRQNRRGLWATEHYSNNQHTRATPLPSTSSKTQ